MATLLGFATLAGCSREATRHPVTGTLKTADGTPVTGGGLILFPTVWTGHLINGSLRDDGTFDLTTSRTDSGETVIQPGCPAGEYRVTFQPMATGDKIIPGIELPGTVTIVAGSNTLTLVLPEAKKPEPEKSEQEKPESDKPKPIGK